ncbi:O-methyltransferase [Pseudonocardia spirodelae]|uniref:Class I SAM-dependent methyltransferase n=1 Tax=Pseudonocardia spirodelae TaxID=3133431 RepID=A0ABU8TDN8_9PSEU
MTGAPVRPARPVTPTTILAELLDDLARRAAMASPGWLADLHRARDLAAGLDPYLDAHTSPASAALVELERRTRAAPWTGTLEQEMLSGHVEGRFLAFLVGMTGARRVLEVGMFTGYSALAMAEALPGDGELVACEVDADVAAFARDCFAGSPAGRRIRVEVGPAADTLARLRGQRFDLVFVDADKAGYAGYLDTLLDGDLLAPGAVVCVDNTLMQGQPWTGGRTPNGDAIAAFNRRVTDDPRVEQVLVPLRDGLTLIRRVA